MKQTKKICILALFVALAFCLSYLESLIPLVNLKIPGLKIGFANIIVLLAIYVYGWKDAAAVSLLRVLLIFLFFGNVTSFLLSLTGAVLSLAVMSVFVLKTEFFSEIGVSVTGSVIHITGQLIAASFIFGTWSVWVYYMYLLPISVASGVFIGFTVRILNRRIKKMLEKIR